MQKVLRLAAYRRLLLAYTLNELAWAIGFVVLVLLVYQRTGSALGAMVFFICAQFVPALISPSIVARLVRFTPKQSLVVLYGLEAAVFLCLSFLAGQFSLAAVLTLAVVDGAVALTARAIARATSVAVVKPAGLLRPGNAVMNTTFSVCFMIGPLIGAGISAAGGTRTALLLNSVLFAAIALTLATASGLPRLSSERKQSRITVQAALAYAREAPVIRTLFGLQAAGLVFFTMSIPVEVVLAQHTLHAGARGYGLLVSAWGTGAVVGSAVYAARRQDSVRLLLSTGTGALGLGFGVMALAPSIGIAICGAAIGGLGNGIQAVSARTALQELTEQRWMALVMSFDESIGEAMPGAGILLGGIITAVSTPRAALAVASVGALTVTAVIFRVFRSSASAGGPERGAALDTVQPASSAVTEV